MKNAREFLKNLENFRKIIWKIWLSQRNGIDGSKKSEKKASRIPLFQLLSDFLRKQESQTIPFIDVGYDIIDIFRCLDPFAYVCFESFVPQKLFLKELLKFFFFVLIDEKKNDKTDKN